ncbi:MAG: NrfD/PsrC family molybdoenzyme membrane anchor subunit [Pseudomonadota bacterium]|nr:NrfD/PsrC family molybdoenzyme membrane anchor subunit [Pseudomonadota bacterium]
MQEVILATARHNAKVDPSLGIWTWEVSVYLFLGGLTAGIMCFAALMVLMRKDTVAPFATNRLALLAPIVLSLGMTTLFLDLEHKLYVFRFYTAFEVTSPMSWGAWILVAIYPISVLQILSTLRVGYPGMAGYAEKLPLFSGVLDLSERFRRPVAGVAIPFAVALGIYTGILLSAFSARPFWNTGVLGPLFLVSGLSTAAALVLLGAREAGEKHLFTRIDLGLIGVELMFVFLLLVNLGTGSGVQIDAAGLVLGGPYTLVFWVLFVTIGLLVPAVLETWEMKGGRALVYAAPILVLFGGYVLRHVTVEAGQFSTWTHYETQYDPALLERLQ